MAGEQAASIAYAEFYADSTHNLNKSIAAGRPIFDDVDMVMIKWTADTKKQLHGPAWDRSDRYIVEPGGTKQWMTWKQAFPEQWKAYQANLDQNVVGTPISELTFLSKARCAEFRAINILTVEGLAALEGPALARIGMDGRTLVEQAKAYLSRAAGSAVDTRMQAQINDQAAIIAEMRAEIAKLTGGGDKAAVDALRKSNVERGGQAPEMTKDADKPAVPGPFDEMDEDFIRAWLKDAQEPDPHPNCKLSTLRSKANEANKKIEDAKRAKVAA